MGVQTIKEVSKATGISRFTLAQVAREGRFKSAAYQSGATWLIDTEHDDFKQWLAAHQEQPRVKGQRKISEKTGKGNNDAFIES